MLFEVLVLILVAAIVDCIISNRNHIGNFRWPFVRDIPSLLWYYSTMHDYPTGLFVKHSTAASITTKLGNVDMVALVDPADIKYLLKDNWTNFVVGKGIRGNAIRDLFGNGIFNADGTHWYLQRKNSSREFSANIFRSVMTKAFVGHTIKLKALLEKAAQDKLVVDMHAMFFKLTLDAFGQVAFGLNVGGLDDKPMPFATAFDRAQEIIAFRVPQPPFVWQIMRWLSIGSERELKRCISTIDDFIYDMIDSRVTSPTTKPVTPKSPASEPIFDDDGYGGLLAKLVRACDDDEEITRETRRKYIRDMVVNFIIAGRDTTACALSWLLDELSTHPDVEKKLLAEIESVFQGRQPSYDDLSECHYLTACLSETLRLHPSVPFDLKTVVAADQFPSGVKVRPGDSAGFHAYAMARLERIWGKDAAEFNPSRWLDEAGAFVRADPFKYPVFQAGPRMCLGVDMAMLEMKVVVSILLPSLRFSVVKEPKFRMGLVLQMKDGLMTKVSLR